MCLARAAPQRSKPYPASLREPQRSPARVRPHRSCRWTSRRPRRPPSNQWARSLAQWVTLHGPATRPMPSSSSAIRPATPARAAVGRALLKGIIGTTVRLIVLLLQEVPMPAIKPRYAHASADRTPARPAPETALPVLITTGPRGYEGEGLPVVPRRSFAGGQLPAETPTRFGHMDQWLSGKYHPATEGAPTGTSHRWFETVTYMSTAGFSHQDRTARRLTRTCAPVD